MGNSVASITRSDFEYDIALDNIIMPMRKISGGRYSNRKIKNNGSYDIIEFYEFCDNICLDYKRVSSNNNIETKFTLIEFPIIMMVKRNNTYTIKNVSEGFSTKTSEVDFLDEDTKIASITLKKYISDGTQFAIKIYDVKDTDYKTAKAPTSGRMYSFRPC